MLISERRIFVYVALVFAFALSARSQERPAREQAFTSARQLADEKRFTDALRTIEPYSSRADDIDARVFAARLHAWAGEYKIAERMYREVLAITTDHLDARLGLADALAWNKDFAAALRQLDLLAALPDVESELLVRRGRYAWWRGDTRGARECFQRLLQLEPNNAEAASVLAAITSRKLFQLDLGYSSEWTGVSPHDSSVGAYLTYRGLQNVTLTAGVVPEERFGESSARFALGTSLAFGGTILSTSGSWATTNTRFTSHSDIEFDALRRMGPISAGAGYRRIAFGGTHIQVPTAIFSWQTTNAIGLDLRYMPSFTAASSTGSWRQGAAARITWDARKWLSPFAAVGVGSTASGLLVNNHIYYFVSQSHTTGARFNYSRSQSISLFYTRENRARDLVAHGFGTTYRLLF